MTTPALTADNLIHRNKSRLKLISVVSISLLFVIFLRGTQSFANDKSILRHFIENRLILAPPLDPMDSKRKDFDESFIPALKRKPLGFGLVITNLDETIKDPTLPLKFTLMKNSSKEKYSLKLEKSDFIVKDNKIFQDGSENGMSFIEFILKNDLILDLTIGVDEDFRVSEGLENAAQYYHKTSEALQLEEIKNLPMKDIDLIHAKEREEIVCHPIKYKLYPEEIDALRSYVEFGYIFMNYVLRQKDQNSEEIDQETETRIKNAVSGLSCFNNYNHFVWRGIKINEQQFKQLQSYNIGDIIYDPSFISASRASEVLDFYCEDKYSIPLIINMFSLTGKPIENFSPNSFRGTENEILFQPNTKFKLISLSDKMVGLKQITPEEEKQYSSKAKSFVLKSIPFREEDTPPSGEKWAHHSVIKDYREAKLVSREPGLIDFHSSYYYEDGKLKKIWTGWKHHDSYEYASRVAVQRVYDITIDSEDQLADGTVLKKGHFLNSKGKKFNITIRYYKGEIKKLWDSQTEEHKKNSGKKSMAL